MTSARGSKKKPAKGNTAPPPAEWERWTKAKGKGLHLSDTPLPQDGSPESSLYHFDEDSWNRFMAWSLNPKPLPIGPSILNLSVATRMVCLGQWLGNEVIFSFTHFISVFVEHIYVAAYVYFVVNIQEMDAFMFIWRVNTTLERWAPRRVAFMNAMFCLQINAAYNNFSVDRRGYDLPDFLLGYGRGELPSHGRNDQVWGVDVDRLYFPLFVNGNPSFFCNLSFFISSFTNFLMSNVGNHWIAVCINIIEKRVQVFDFSRGRNRQHVEKFAALIPRIVKAVAPPQSKKQLLLQPYSIVEVPMKARLNKSCCDCGVYALKHLECHLLGLDLSLVDDENIQGCRQKIAVDLWEATHDPIYAEAMKQYVPSPWERSGSYDLED